MKSLLAFALLIAVPMFAANPARAVVDEAKRYGSDAVAIARAPLTWDAAMWKRVGLITVADAATFAADESIADFVQRNRNHTTDDFAKAITPLGGGRALQLSAATLLTGLVTRNTNLRDTGRDAIEASIFAAGIVTPAIKRVVGRERPNGGNYSFPSGHATNAFAVASVFAAHSEGWIVPTIAYTLATGVAASRMNDNVHFASDVLAGAAIGTAMGRSIVARHRGVTAVQTPRITWTITPTRGGAGIEVTVPFDRIANAFARR